MKLRVKQTKFRVLVVDCPWQANDGLGTRGAAANYEVQHLDQLKGYRLPPHEDDCVLFMWRLAIMQEEALAVTRSWGFNPTKGEMVWRKLTPTGKEHFGMGYIVRGAHESCIIATKGKPPVKHHSQRSLFSAPVPRYEEGPLKGRIIHSGKPDEFFRIVADMYDGPRASVFERRQRPGFVCFGDEMRHEDHQAVRSAAGTRDTHVAVTEGV